MKRNAFMWITFFIAFDVASIVSSGVAAWVPAFATRRFGGDVVGLMGILGTMQSAGALIGSAAGGCIAMLMVRSGRSHQFPHVLAALTLIDCAAYAFFPYAGSWTLAAAGDGLGAGAAAALVVIVFVGIQEAAPNEVRGQLFGIFCGLSFVPSIAGPTAVAMLSEHFGAWGGGLAPAFTVVGLTTGLAGAALYVLCARPYAAAIRDFRRAVS
jgi:MFS family permease